MCYIVTQIVLGIIYMKCCKGTMTQENLDRARGRSNKSTLYSGARKL